MRALLAQVKPHPIEPGRNAGQAADLIRATPEADLVAFPELYLSGYDLARSDQSAIDLDSGPIAVIREAAETSVTAVAVGFVERRGPALANSLALIDQHGELASVYRKTHLFGEEASVFEAGDHLLVVELAHRRIGPLICFDMEFCEPARALARAGADLFLSVAANMAPFSSDHLIAAQARALDNRLAHLYVNRCGEEAGLRFVGGTRSVRPNGTVAAEIEGEHEGVLMATPERPGTTDARVDYLEHTREDLEVMHPATSTGGI